MVSNNHPLLPKIISYEPTAYRSDHVPTLPRANALHSASIDPDFKNAQQLPWGNTQAVIPGFFMAQSSPEKLARLDKKYILQNFQLNKNAKRFDHICIRSAIETKTARYCGNIYRIGKSFTPFACIVMLIVLLALWILTAMPLVELLLTAQTALLLFIAFPLGMWLLALLFSEICRLPLDQPLYRRTWEFNRQNGMVTLYDDSKKKHLAFQKPFIEFDAYLITSTDKKNNSRYQLAFKNRYNGMKITQILKNPLYDKNEVLAMWDFLQNYMDTSQALPDDGRLELFRPYDPTSIQQDKEQKRNPRYWRDMSDTAWQLQCAQMTRQINIISFDERNNLIKEHLSQDTVMPETFEESLS